MNKKEFIYNVFFFSFTLALVGLMGNFVIKYLRVIDQGDLQNTIFIILVITTAIFSLLVTIFNVLKFIKKFSYITYIASTILLVVTGYLILNIIYIETMLQTPTSFMLLSLIIIKTMYNFYLFYTNFEIRK